LILSFLALVIFHRDKEKAKSIIVLQVIFILGFIIEAIGVNTGLFFGNYQYGNSLGPKLFNAPLIIGLNWIFLTYTTASVLENIKIHYLIKIVLASIVMLVYDFVLEQVAPKIDMWSWSDGKVPITNYLDWFLVALMFHSIIKVSRVKTDNPLALLILGCQFAFFLSLFFILS
jgi:bisanhydrobacterioruberin hydratase